MYKLNKPVMQLTVILDNVRSAHNVGSILRTAESAGILNVFCCGSTPYPKLKNDQRDPVVINRNMRQIAKTALGAELTVQVEYISDPLAAIAKCRQSNCTIYGLEKSPQAQNLLKSPVSLPAALIVGNEVEGIQNAVLEQCDQILEIPQFGSKESLNVAVAAGIGIYRFVP